MLLYFRNDYIVYIGGILVRKVCVLQAKAHVCALRSYANRVVTVATVDFVDGFEQCLLLRTVDGVEQILLHYPCRSDVPNDDTRLLE